MKTQNGDMDGIPVAMMEAMACKVPVISTRISGIPELVIHNVNGLLVDTNDDGRETRDEGRPSSLVHRSSLIEALADAIEMLLSDSDKIRRFGLTARQQVEQNFNVTKTSAQLRQLIQEQYDEKIKRPITNCDVPCLQSVC
jgi:glycosyltransferase involved in cell wall biosynthesis